MLSSTVRQSRRFALNRTSFEFSSKFAAVIIAAIFFGSGPSQGQSTTDETKPVVQTDDKIEHEIQSLVQQLAASKYAERNEATVRLRQFGEQALPIVRQHRNHSNMEVRLRCRSIQNEIEERLRERIIASFVASGSGGDQLPGWTRMKTIAGDSRDSRRWFARVVADHWSLLDSLTGDEATTNVQSEVLQLVQLRRKYPIQPSAEELSVFLLVANEMDPSGLSQVISMLSQFSPKPTNSDAWNQPVFRDLASHVIRECDSSYLAFQAISLALRRDLRAGLHPALQILRSSSASPTYRQTAILAVARFGDEQHVKSLESHLDDTDVCFNRPINRLKNNFQVPLGARKAAKTEFVVQVRDVALAAMMHLLSQDPSHFGFAELKRNSFSVFQSHSLGFSTEEQREQTFAKWEKFRIDKELPSREITASAEAFIPSPIIQESLLQGD